VIFIDDDSQDRGKNILEDLIDQNEDKELQFHILENLGKGKKEAVLTALRIASGEYIFTTDADCILPEFWIESMLAHLSRPNTQMTAGPVITFGSKSFLDQFQQIEWASILLVTKAGFELKNPIMCSAANMAYRKAAFQELTPYEDNLHHLSGDDEFLLKKMVKKFGSEAVTYTFENLVWTNPQVSWKDLLSQRIRWISKWRLHKSFHHAVFTLAPMTIQLVFISSLGLILEGQTGVSVLLILWLGKFWFEWKTLAGVLKSFEIRHAPLIYFLTSILHPFYVICIGFGSLFGNFEWKGRNSSDIT
jgi:cellulose synthase/poly-beta-1,6-N-acetylglucosamine synthase-like glycosyltransferase